jgi:3-dehydroquinate dehydratase II
VAISRIASGVIVGRGVRGYQLALQHMERPAMQRVIFVLNGPNLNMLGVAAREYCGSGTLEDLRDLCEAKARSIDFAIDFRQSNCEGDIVEACHEARTNAAGIVINPAALSFTSPSLTDALRAFSGPKIEVHINNVYARDSSYHNSQVSQVVTAVIAGLGFEGYEYALDAVRQHLCAFASVDAPRAEGCEHAS